MGEHPDGAAWFGAMCDVTAPGLMEEVVVAADARLAHKSAMVAVTRIVVVDE